ncbi:MAG TPA: hypothetical protein VF841_13155 [Anaeromyxobacter sp.]
MARVRELAGPVAVAFVAALAIAGVSSCGPGKSTGPSGPTSPTGTSGPSGPATGGGSTGGGSGSGGSGGGSGGGTSGGSGSGGGGSTTSGGGTSSGDGTASGGGATPAGDGSGTSPGAPDACSGLLPTADAGHALRFDTGTHANCWRATSSANGQLALGILTGASGARFLLYPPDGSAQQGEIALLYPSGRTDLDPWFHPTSAGWAGMVHDPPPAVALRAFDTTGSPIGTSQDLVVNSAPDGHGGTVAIAASSAPATPDAPALEWFDASGTLLRTAPLDDHPTMLLVAFGTDHVLAITTVPGDVRARWYDGSGTPITAWFDAGPTADATPASLHLLLDGTIALSDGSAWRGIFRDGVAAMDPAPGWLASRPATRLATIRGGRAYAVLPMPSAPQPGAAAADQTRFEIVAASGASCGTVTLPAPAGEPGVTRTPTALDVGQDGTVLQTESLTGDRLGSGIHGEFRWWPGLLR